MLPVVTEIVLIKDWEWKEREVWILGAGLCLQSMDTVTATATRFA